MHELRLLARTWATADVGAARLKIGKRARARDLEPLADPRRPRLKIVGLRGREPEVVDRQHRHAIRQLQASQHRFGVPGELLVLCRRIARAAEAYQLHLIELMDAQQPARVFARRARFAPETGRVRGVAHRQRRAVEDLVAVEVRHWNLRGRDEKQIVRGAIHVGFELGQLAGADHDFTPHQKRRLDLGVAMFAGVEVEHEVDERARQPSTLSLEHWESRTRELRASGQVQDPELLRDFPMRLAAFRRRGSPTS